jgi:choline dehydrogenase-like flavoprotein
VQVYQSPSDASRSYFSATCFGEMVPRAENRVTLHPSRKDAWGIPVLNIEASHDEVDLELAREETTSLRELADVAGVALTSIEAFPAPPGSANHECGTARMGSDPSNSVLDTYNECWDARGLFLTDGACLPSQGTQNPTLTLLALTARACDTVIQRYKDQ